jgi:dTDP-4-dehydrorhamnose 3,5-epimerase
MLPKLSIDGVVVREIRRHQDRRGWLAELFRQDQLDQEFHPVMSYVSMTHPGIARGPHEHADQADLFCFIGPSTFRIDLWDNRLDSKTHRTHDRFEAGEDSPLMVLVPKGVVHAYKNVGDREGIVINCPNRLYGGAGRNEPVDEIRHEDDPDGRFRVD